MNLAKLIYEAYPDDGFLPIDPKVDCVDLSALHRVCQAGVGDTLFAFIVGELYETVYHECGPDESDGDVLCEAATYIRRARDDIEAVLAALTNAQSVVGVEEAV